MGVKIEGNRLGLGTNLFSEELTLMESVGEEELKAELKKKSEFLQKVSGIDKNNETVLIRGGKMEGACIEAEVGSDSIKVNIEEINRAQGIVDKMKKAGVPAYLSPIQAKSGRIYRVQAGPFKSAKEAEAANAKLGLAGLNTGKVQSVR